jgi:hypothetical protein
LTENEDIFVFSVGSAPESARMASVCCLVAVSVEKVIKY